jgi:hypothetical protein
MVATTVVGVQWDGVFLVRWRVWNPMNSPPSGQEVAPKLFTRSGQLRASPPCYVRYGSVAALRDSLRLFPPWGPDMLT